jgi:hypothetical protein
MGHTHTVRRAKYSFMWYQYSQHFGFILQFLHSHLLVRFHKVELHNHAKSDTSYYKNGIAALWHTKNE